jgi:hypothetical protein
MIMLALEGQSSARLRHDVQCSAQAAPSATPLWRPPAAAWIRDTPSGRAAHRDAMREHILARHCALGLRARAPTAGAARLTTHSRSLDLAATTSTLRAMLPQGWPAGRWAAPWRAAPGPCLAGAHSDGSCAPGCVLFLSTLTGDTASCSITVGRHVRNHVWPPHTPAHHVQGRSKLCE